MPSYRLIDMAGGDIGIVEDVREADRGRRTGDPARRRHRAGCRRVRRRVRAAGDVVATLAVDDGTV
jgi:hypothetical protein